MRYTICLSALLSALVGSMSVTALRAEEAVEPGWSYQATLGLERAPAYTGSDVYVSEADVGLNAIYTNRRGTQWMLGTGGVGVRQGLGRGVTVQAGLEYEFGRDNDDDPILSGFEVVEDTVELQIELVKEFGDFYVGSGIQHDIRNRGKGTVGFLGLGYETALTSRLTFEVAGDISFANADHINTEVGISAAASAASGLSAYEASGGYKGVSLEVGLEYALTQSTALFGSLGVERYGANMSDSPLIRDEGRATSSEIELGVAFTF